MKKIIISYFAIAFLLIFSLSGCVSMTPEPYATPSPEEDSPFQGTPFYQTLPDGKMLCVVFSQNSYGESVVCNWEAYNDATKSE